MTDCRAGFFDFFSRQASRHTHLQSRRNNLLRFEVVLEGLEASNEDTIRKALFQNVSMSSALVDGRNLPHQLHLAARIVDPQPKVA